MWLRLYYIESLGDDLLRIHRFFHLLPLLHWHRHSWSMWRCIHVLSLQSWFWNCWGLLQKWPFLVLGYITLCRHRETLCRDTVPLFFSISSQRPLVPEGGILPTDAGTWHHHCSSWHLSCPALVLSASVLSLSLSQTHRSHTRFAHTQRYNQHSPCLLSLWYSPSSLNPASVSLTFHNPSHGNSWSFPWVSIFMPSILYLYEHLFIISPGFVSISKLRP